MRKPADRNASATPDQGNLRADDYQVSSNITRQRHYGVRVVDVGDLAMERSERLHADVTGGNVNVVDGGIVKQA